MKKAILIILTFLLLFNLFLPTAYAEKNIEDEIEDEVKKSLDELLLNDFEKFFADIENSLKSNLGSSIKEIINQIIKNEKKFGIKDVFKIITDSFQSSLFSLVAPIISIVILAILLGVFKNLSSGFIKEGTNEIIYYVCLSAIIIILSAVISGVVVSTKSTISLVQRFVDIVFPILLTLVTALGGVSSVAIYQPMTVILTTVIIKLITLVVMPLFIASMVFNIVGNISSSIKLEKFTKTTKSSAEWLLGLSFGLFLTFVTSEGIAGAAFDTIAVKSAKFALSSYVPILGGYLSEGFDLIMASCVLIKNALGLTSIFVLMLIVLAPAIKILALSLMLKLASAVVEMISDKRIADMLYNTSKILMILFAIIIGLGFLIFIIIMLIICTCNFGVI